MAGPRSTAGASAGGREGAPPRQPIMHRRRRAHPASPPAHRFPPPSPPLQELSKLSISGSASLESLTATAKQAEAEPYLLQHLPAVLKAAADKVRAARRPWVTVCRG